MPRTRVAARVAQIAWGSEIVAKPIDLADLLTRIEHESGDAATLQAINKGVTPEGTVQAYRHVVSAGIELSVYLLIGVAGIERWREHALESAHVLGQTPPAFVRLRTFVPVPGTRWHDRWREGALTLLSAHQALEETSLVIEHLGGPTTLVSVDEHLRWPVTAFRPPTQRLLGLGL